MARSIWKGSISFGLVNIPVTLYPGEQRDEIHFTLLDRHDMSPVGYRRVNKQTGNEVDWEDIVKGYQYEKDQYVVLGEEELRHANVKATQSVEILDFVKTEQIPFVYFDRPYYLEPAPRIGEKGYALLRETLQRSGRAGIAQVVLHTRQHLAMLAPVGEVLVLNLLRYEHELRAPTDVKAPARNLAALRISRKEIEMAARLVEDMSVAWEPARYRDAYREDIRRFVEKKIAAGKTLEIEPAEEPPAPRAARVLDFMTLLKRSIEETERERPAARTARPRRRATARHGRRHA
jgi:DNA end-binding protein Ku